MSARIFRNLGSAIVLAAYTFVASGTSLERPDRLGEFPVGLFVHDDTAYLLHYATGPYAPGPHRDQSISLTAISRDGSVAPLQPVAIPHTEDTLLSGAVTAGTNGAVALVVASASSQGPYAVVLTDKGTSSEVPAPGGRYPSAWERNDKQLTFIKRDAARYWVYYSRATHRSYSGGVSEDARAVFPLFEVEDGRASVLADRVVWARCDEVLCQQVRYDGQTLRLFANPVTSDLYLRAVTEVAASGWSHESAADSDGRPLLVVGDAMYALSATTPSLQFVKMLNPDRRSTLGPDNEDTLTGYFADGARIQVAYIPDQPRSSYCDEDCLERYEVYVTRVVILSARGELVREFSMHDY